jgi:hypothetical protein
MPCEFVTIRVQRFDLPTNEDIDIDLEFSAQGVVTNRRAILMYQAFVIRRSGGGLFGAIGGQTATLVATLNGQPILEQALSVAPPGQSFHTIIDRNIVQAADNTLTLSRQAGQGTGTIRLSNLVLVYGI